jgi:hypothetical protein
MKMAVFDSALHKLREQLTLNQRATGSIPTRPTNSINDLGHPRQHLIRGKTCFKPVFEVGLFRFSFFQQRARCF